MEWKERNSTYQQAGTWLYFQVIRLLKGTMLNSAYLIDAYIP